jgi:predicted nucleic acid-binding protein
MDAVVAAIAVEQGATLYTTDRDFSRFAGLKWTNPLASRQ